MNPFQKLAICRGLDFAFPEKPSEHDVFASFERGYWLLEDKISEDKRPFASSYLKSTALEYASKRMDFQPKALSRAIGQLRKQKDIIITKPDKGSGVVIMNKAEYLELLKEASVYDTSKFKPVSDARPKSRGRPPKHFHPLLQREKQLNTAIKGILPQSLYDKAKQSGSRLAHLYGLPKTHKEKLAMRPILSATGTYNYNLAKLLDELLKPLSVSEFAISDIGKFAEEILSARSVEDGNMLVSYDVTALFTNVPLEETIQFIVDKAFTNDWFNTTYSVKLKKADLRQLLLLATKNQLFTLDGQLYEQVDGVAMGSPLGPLMANAFMRSVEEKLLAEKLLPSFYWRYVDDTITLMPSIDAANNFSAILNNCHNSIKVTMEIAINNALPFCGMLVSIENGCFAFNTYRKPTDTGLLLHFNSFVDLKYKRSLIQTMLHRAYNYNSDWHKFVREIDFLWDVFSALQYPRPVFDAALNKFLTAKFSKENVPTIEPNHPPVRFVIPYKGYKQSLFIKQRFSELTVKVGAIVQPVFVSKKVSSYLSPREIKPEIVNRQCVVYQYKCDQCDAGYIGMTSQHLHQRIESHMSGDSAITRHLKAAHKIQKKALDIRHCFHVLKKCRSKFDCLVSEMIFIQKMRPSLNVQSDSLKAKVFV